MADPVGVSDQSSETTATDRMWARVEKTEGCWFWQGWKNADGYGLVWIDPPRRPGRRAATAHRLAYEALVGPIPDGLLLDHLCRVRHCVNPAHLEPVSNAENKRRARAQADEAVNGSAATRVAELEAALKRASDLIADETGMVSCWHELPSEDCVQCVIDCALYRQASTEGEAS